MLAPARSRRRRSRIRREDSPPPSMSQLNFVDIPQPFIIPSSIRPSQAQLEPHSQRNLVSSTNTSQSNSALSSTTTSTSSSSSASLSPLSRRTSVQFPNLQIDNSLLSSTIPTSPSSNHFDTSYSNQLHQQQYNYLHYHRHHHHHHQQHQPRRGHSVKSTHVSLVPTRRLSINNNMNDDNKDNDDDNNNNDMLEFNNMLNATPIDNLRFREEQLESHPINSYSNISPQLSSQSSLFSQSIQQNRNSHYPLYNNNNDHDTDFSLPFHLQSPPISPTHTSLQNKLNRLNRKYHFNQSKYNSGNNNNYHHNNNYNKVKELINDAKNKLQSIEQSLNEDAWMYYGINPLENI